MSWWRTWHDRGEASLPRLVREADRRWRRRAASDHAARVKERLAARYTAEVDLRVRLGLPTPAGRPRRASPREAASVRGLYLADYPDLLLEWAWDVPRMAPVPQRAPARPGHAASAREAVWRCELGHEWSAPVYQRTLSGSGCPDCYRLTAAARSRAGRQRARRARDTEAMAKVVALRPPAATSEAV